MSEVLARVIGDTSKKVKIWGIVTLVLGVLAIVAPFVTGLAVAIFVGILLLLSGIAQTIYAFQAGSLGKGLLRVLFGGITIVGGVAMITSPTLGLAALTLILAAYFFIDGVFALFAGFQVKPLKGWGWLVFSGVVTVLLAWMIWQQWPLSGLWAVGILVGVRLLFAGTAMIALGSAGKKVVGEMRGASPI